MRPRMMRSRSRRRGNNECSNTGGSRFCHASVARSIIGYRTRRGRRERKRLQKRRHGDREQKTRWKKCGSGISSAAIGSLAERGGARPILPPARSARPIRVPANPSRISVSLRLRVEIFPCPPSPPLLPRRHRKAASWSHDCCMLSASSQAPRHSSSAAPRRRHDRSRFGERT